jgi:hypothetical protein
MNFKSYDLIVSVLFFAGIVMMVLAVRSLLFVFS